MSSLWIIFHSMIPEKSDLLTHCRYHSLAKPSVCYFLFIRRQWLFNTWGCWGIKTTRASDSAERGHITLGASFTWELSDGTGAPGQHSCTHQCHPASPELDAEGNGSKGEQVLIVDNQGTLTAWFNFNPSMDPWKWNPKKTNFQYQKCLFDTNIEPNPSPIGAAPTTSSFSTFKCIFLNENVTVLIKISPKGPINNIPTLELLPIVKG